MTTKTTAETCRLWCCVCGDTRDLDGHSLAELTVSLPAMWSGWFLYHEAGKESSIPRVYSVCHLCLFHPMREQRLSADWSRQ